MLRGNEAKVYIYAKKVLPTLYGRFELRVFRNTADSIEHLAITRGNPQEAGLGFGILEEA